MARIWQNVSGAVFLILVTGCATNVSFKSADLGRDDLPRETVSGLFGKPEGKGPFPAVILLHTCGGVLPHVAEDWPNFLKQHGYATLTVDTFGSRGAGKCPDAYRFGGMTMWRDAYGALDYLASRPDIDADRIGVMGFSLGAHAVEELASNHLRSDQTRFFRAGISVYGHCTVYSRPLFPLLEIIGDQDRNSGRCPREPAEGLSIRIVKGAHHGFDQSRLFSGRHVSGDHFAIYSWPATKQARAATLRFFARHLSR